LYNHKVRLRWVGDSNLVLRKAKVSDSRHTRGKLTPKQEGPYRVVYTIQDGTYVLVIMDGNVLPRTWHISTHR
ncbi:hypothetical protein BHE74_00016287, partial [Ensete ventricosum]